MTTEQEKKKSRQRLVTVVLLLLFLVAISIGAYYIFSREDGEGGVSVPSSGLSIPAPDLTAVASSQPIDQAFSFQFY